MKNLKFIKNLTICVIVVLFLNSCEKVKDDIQNSLETKKVVFIDAATSEMNFLFSYSIFDKAVNNVSKSLIIDSAHIRRQGDTLFIDYGTSFVTCPDGHRRKGKMTAVFSDFINFDQAGATANIVIDNLYDNDYCLNGTVNINNLGVANNRIKYNIIANPGTSLVTPVGTISFVVLYNLEWDRGTSSIDDDILYVLTSSTSTGVASNGVDFTMSIDNQVVLDNACQFKVTGGKLRLTSTQFPADPSFIDFGNGCDNALQLIINTNGITTTLDYTIDQLF